MLKTNNKYIPPKKQYNIINPALLEGKIPPQSIDIEEALLGAMLIDKEAAIKISMKMKAEYFYTDSHQKIFQSIKDLINKRYDGVDLLTVTDQLRIKGELDEIGGPITLSRLTNIIPNAYKADVHSSMVIDKYLLRNIIKISSEASNNAFQMVDPLDIAEEMEKELGLMFDLENLNKNPFSSALEHTMTDIIARSDGKSQYIKTGDKYLDNEIAFRRGFICVLAGEEGTGKTKYVIKIIKNILDHKENDVGVLWFTMEDDRKQIVRSFISMDVKITTRALQSINYQITSDDIIRIKESIKEFENYDVEFIDRITPIHQIVNQSRRFTDERSYKDSVIVIDNLGLIDTDQGMSGVERDDYLMGKIKGIADETQAFIILVHHFSKAASSEFLREEAYRPRKQFIKGSTRIIDYVQQALLINLPRKHKDVIQDEKNKYVHVPKEEGEGFNEKDFLEHFWILNPTGDYFTNNVDNLPHATWGELGYATKHKQDIYGKKVGVKWLIEKYIQYLNYIESSNAGRRGRKEKPVSIYTFLKKSKFNEDFSPPSNSKSYYLYGNNMDLKDRLEELFIVEAVKNRDGGTADENILFRYIADLNHNIFTPIK